MMKPRTLNRLVGFEVFIQLVVLAFGYLALEQKKYEVSLTPDALTAYEKRVEDLQSAVPGDLALAIKGVYYVKGRGEVGIVVKKTPLEDDVELLPPIAGRNEIVGLIHQGDPDYNYFAMKYSNQF